MRLQVRIEGCIVWLSQCPVAELCQVSAPTVNRAFGKHLHGG